MVKYKDWADMLKAMNQFVCRLFIWSKEAATVEWTCPKIAYGNEEEACVLKSNQYPISEETLCGPK